MINVTDMQVTIDGLQYTGRELAPEGQELLRHVVDLRERKRKLQFRLTQIDVADHAFSEALRQFAPQQKEDS